jgi:large subunit ribosomal protein L4
MDRINGLTGALAAKFAQNDLIIVDTLDQFPFTEPNEMKQFLDDKQIGPSCLIVDAGDLFPRNISLASEAVLWVNLMPAYGLNVMSMLKHETLVMTVAALLHVEERLLYNMHRTDVSKADKKYQPPPVCQDRDPHLELPTVEYLNGDMYDLE